MTGTGEEKGRGGPQRCTGVSGGAWGTPPGDDDGGGPFKTQNPGGGEGKTTTDTGGVRGGGRRGWNPRGKGAFDDWGGGVRGGGAGAPKTRGDGARGRWRSPNPGSGGGRVATTAPGRWQGRPPRAKRAPRGAQEEGKKAPGPGSPRFGGEGDAGGESGGPEGKVVAGAGPRDVGEAGRGRGSGKPPPRRGGALPPGVF